MMSHNPGGHQMSFLKKRPRDPGVMFQASEPLEVNVVDTSIGTGGGSCGEGADKTSPSATSGTTGVGGTTATASPRSLAATTASMTTPNHSPGFMDPDAIMTSNEEHSSSVSPASRLEDEPQRKSTYEEAMEADQNVVLRKRMNGSAYRKVILKRNSYSTTEAGRLLKLCLEKHFEGNQDENAALDNYVHEVFNQLDYHRCGTVSREDFETLCEVLDLHVATSRPQSTNNNNNHATSHYRLSGLEWLSSYRPRSPLSPLRMDKLNEVKYRGPKKVSIDPQPPNFLFTIGPRPFWEMWPQKKRRKRRLNMDEFKRALLEQWARCQGIPANRVSILFTPTTMRMASPTSVASNGGIYHRNHRHIRSVRIQPIPIVSNDAVDHVHHQRNGGAKNGLLASTASNSNGGPRVHYETRTKRFFRRLARVSRRVHFIRRLSRRIRRENIGPPLQPRIAINPALRPQSIKTSAEEEETTVVNGGASFSVEKQRERVHLLEQQVEHQQTEISGLRDVVEDLRSSLQLSDAQNLALQVLLKKMAKAEVQLPVIGHDSFRSQMDESEKHLENLVKELKEMSQTKYPTYLPTSNLHGGSSSTATSINGGNMTLPDFVLEDEVLETTKVLGEASDELKAATSELQTTVTRLQQEATEDIQAASLREAYRALERAQQELNKMRIQLEEAQSALEATKSELNETRDELIVTQSSLRNSDMQLRDTERRLSLLNQNRRSLVLELQTTRELLASSLKKVQDLELESRKVPSLENRIHELERSLNKRMTTVTNSDVVSHQAKQVHNHHHHHLAHHLPHHLRPLSTVDSGLYSTSDSDHEDNCPNKPHDNSLEGVSDDDAAFAEGISGSPRDSGRSSSGAKFSSRPHMRPPKSPRPFTPILEQSLLVSKSPSTSGNHSGGSKFSVSSPSASPSSVGGTKSPIANMEYQMQNFSISSPTAKGGEEAISKLRKEITSLRERFANRQKDWAEERNLLLEELFKRREDPDSSKIAQQNHQMELTLLEEKIREVLNMLRSLNSMEISPKTLGKLVLDSVERSVDPLSGEIVVFKFLNHLYHSARDYERMSAESMIHKALQAVEAHSQTLAQMEAESSTTATTRN